jgi:hypothetical protein
MAAKKTAKKLGASAAKVMPKYHFDLVASKTIADEGAAEVCNDIGAMDIAQELARRLVKEPELKDRHYAILVSTEDGDEVGRAPLDPHP